MVLLAYTELSGHLGTLLLYRMALLVGTTIDATFKG